MLILDKAKYHLQGDFPAEISKENAYSLGGMFLGWCAENNLTSDSLKEDFPKEIDDFLTHTGQVNDLYRICGGVLSEEELSSLGIAFANDYFNSENGLYMDDFVDILADKFPTPYHVPSTWENYDLLRRTIDQRFAEWKQNK
jgi:hypothetical protein